jgi:uncharacterized protein (DUF433 family)
MAMIGGRLGLEENDVDRHAWMGRISIDPAVHHGEPCIKGTRIPVSLIVGNIADGDKPEDLLSAYPTLTLEDIRAALLYAAEAVRDAPLVPLAS